MQNIKIYYLINQLLDNRNINRFNFNKFSKKKIKIRVINFYNQNKFKYSKFEYYNFYDNKFKLVKDIIFNRPKYFVDISNKTIVEIFIQRLLTIFGSKRVIFDIGLIPVEKIKYGLLRYFLKNKRYLNFFCKIIERIFYKLIFLAILPRVDVSFTSGIVGRKLATSRKDKKIVQAHNLDFDNFLKINKKKNNSKNLIVYIDQNIENSIDFEMDGIKFYNVKKFNKTISKFLSSFGSKVVIAGNNRRKIKKNIFGIKTIYNKTDQLIKDSKLVISHNSTALQYAVLFKKPIILLSTKEIQLIPTMHKNILILKKLLNCNYHFLKDDFSKKKKINYKFNKKLYSKYINDYITENPNNKRKFFDLILNNLDLN